MHDFNDLISIFQACFFTSHNTILVKGGDEPIYYPQSALRPHAEVVFARGFFASALHEIAHWLVAGEKRRQLEDYGYWYEPDGRDAEKQALFQKVEIKPQAIEWILSKACGFKFRISNDNLDGAEGDSEQFKQDIQNQVMLYLDQGLPERTRILKEALCNFYGTDTSFEKSDFLLTDLD
jgi:elongation factor P hydroxylase